MVEDLAVDAQRVRPGSVFFCVRGFGVDGHDWAAEAVANGAVALVVERRLDLPAPQIVVADARAALATVSDEYWGKPTETLPVVGVTGTSGKTTTAYLLHSILEAAGRRPGLYGTIETQIGSERTPSPTWTPVAFHLHGAFRSMLDAGNLSCAIEATSYDSDLRRLDRVRFAALVFTNLGHDHLDYHGTLERYFAAKRRLFLDGSPPAAINVDDPYGRRLLAELRERGHDRLLTFGLSPEADISPEELDLSAGGARFRVGGSRAAHAPARGLQRRERSGERSQARACSACPTTRSPPASRPGKRARPHGADRRGAAVLGLRRLRPQAGGPRSRPADGADAHRRTRAVRVRLRRRLLPGQAAADGPDRVRA